MALQSMLPNPEPPVMKRGRLRRLLEEQRESLALLIQRNLEDQREYSRLLVQNDEIWEGLLGEEAPVLRVTAVAS